MIATRFRARISGEIGDDRLGNSEAVFAAPHADEVGRLARRGAMWSLLLIAFRQVLTLATTAALARLLTPDDYGLLGMVATLTAFLQALSNLGLSAATIQHKGLSVRQVHNMFWINAAIGVALWAVCILVAPRFAAFYGRGELRAVTVAMGATFAIGGLALQPSALLARRMDFGRITLAELGAFLISTPVALVLAWRGWGYWAIVGQALAAQMARLVLVFAASGYRPGWPRPGAGTLGLVKVGGYLSVSWAVTYFARNLDNVIVGKSWGAVEMGYYSRAYFLMGLPTMLALGTLDGVMVPALSALHGDPERLGHAYRKSLQWIALVSFPLAAGLAVTAPEAIRLMYGPRWLDIVPILLWLSIAAICCPLYNTIGWLYIASRNGRRYAQWTIGSTALLVAGYLLGARWGACGVAASYGLLLTLILAWPGLYLAHRAAGLELRPTVRMILPILGATALMAAVCFGTGLALETAGVGWAWRLLIKVAVGVVVYAAANHRFIGPLLAGSPAVSAWRRRRLLVAAGRSAGKGPG
ncbi:MAG: polysaccharide biosynthesis protein [Planctomycetota bacterium]|nr:polysaccharide biosynthesis protein [Planctomycetota bacterium]